MPSDNNLVMPVQGQAPDYRHIAQIVGRDLGVEGWGSAVEHVSFSSSGQYAHTIRNRGTGGHINVLKSTDGTSMFRVTDSGVFMDTLTITTLNAGTIHATTVNAVTVNATTATVGTLAAALATVSSSLVVATAGAASLLGDVTIGATAAKTLTVRSQATFLHATGTSTLLAVDPTNNRVLAGTSTPPGGLANDLLDVIGGRAYFVGTNEQISLGLRYGPSQTGTYYLGVTNQSTPSLLLKDTSGDEVAAFGDAGDTYQLVLTGTGRASGNWFAAKMAVGATSFAGTEAFRVVGTSLFGSVATFGSSVTTSGGITMSTGNFDGVGGTGGQLRIGGVIVNAVSFAGSEKLHVNGTIYCNAATTAFINVVNPYVTASAGAFLGWLVIQLGGSNVKLPYYNV